MNLKSNKGLILESEEIHQRMNETIQSAFNKTYGSKPNIKPKNMHEAIKKKQNNQPFYQGDKKKLWE